MGATGRVGPRDRRRCRLALPTGRSDPRRAGRCAWQSSTRRRRRCPSTPRRSSTRASSPCAMPGTGRTICVTWCVSPRLCRRRWRTGIGFSRSWLRTPYSPTLSSRPPAASDMPLAALAAMRREQELSHGLRGFLADLHNAGAAMDFSVMYPGGQLVDAPLPTWTHRRLLLNRGRSGIPDTRRFTVPVHPLMGAHVRLHEEPERHVWQGEVGTAAQPWLGDHRIHNVAVLPGAAYCEMACAAARAVLGEESEVRDIRFEHDAFAGRETPYRAVASMASPGIVNFVVETDQESAQIRRATQCFTPAGMMTSHPRTTWPPCWRPTHADCDGAEMRKRLDQRGIQYGPAFAGLAAVHIADGDGAAQCWPRSGCLALSARTSGYGSASRAC